MSRFVGAKRYREYHAEMQAHILNCCTRNGAIWQPAHPLPDVIALIERGYLIATGRSGRFNDVGVPLPVFQYKLASEMWAQS